MHDFDQFEEIFRKARIGLMLLADDVIVDCNDAAQEYFDTKDGRLIGTSIFAVTPDVQLDGKSSRAHYEELRSLALAGNPQETTWRYCGPDETYPAAEVSLTKLDHHEAANLVVSIRDITLEQRNAQEDRFKASIIESAGSVISTADLEGCLTYVNPRFLEIWGYTKPDEVLGRHLTDFWLLGDSYETGYQQLMESGTWNGESRGRRSDGSLFDVLIHASVIRDEQGNPIALTSTTTDISERKQEQAERDRLIEVSESAKDIISTATPDGKIIYMNKTGREVLGWDAAGSYLIKDVHSTKIFEMISKAGLPAAIENGFWEGESAILDHSGKEIPVSQLIMSHQDDEGTLRFFSTIMRDISHQKLAARERQKRIDFFSNLEKIDVAIRSSSNMETLLNNVLKALMEILDCDRVWMLYPNDPDAEFFTVPMEVTKPEYPGAKEFNVKVPVTEWTATVMRDAMTFNEPIVNGPAEDRPVPKDVAEAFGVKSQMFTALYPKVSKPWLLGVHQCSHARRFSDEEQTLFKAVSRRLNDSLNSMLILRDLEQSKERFQLAAHCASDLIYELDIETGELEWFGDTVKVIGYEKKVLSQDPKFWFGIVHPDDREEMVVANSLYRSTGKPMFIEYRIRHGDGSWRYWTTTGTAILDEKGQPAKLIGVCADITQRKVAEQELSQREEKYRLLAENVSDVIWTADMTGKMLYVSPSIKRLRGVGTDEAMQIGLFESLTPESSRVATSTLLNELNRDREPGVEQDRSVTLELELIKHDGSTVWTEATVTTLRDELGNLSGMLGVTRDISERKQAELERRELERHLRQAQKLEAIGTLAGGIAHDFNNILFAILGNAELALDDITSEDSAARSSLEGIVSAGKRAKSLVSQILSFARQAEIKFEPMQIGPVISEVLQLVRSTQPTNIEIDKQINAPDATVIGDPTQVHQVILNLCNNACQSMLDNGGRMMFTQDMVELSAESAGPYGDLTPGDYMKLVIEDSGYGMTPEVKERIFEPFFTTKTKDKGSGLGLSVVHGIVTGMGGSITVESEVGHGSVFTVLLPVSDKIVESDQHADDSIQDGTERIMVIDDEEPIIQVVRTMLTRRGYEITAFMSSAEALSAFKKDPQGFDLVITDQTMPVITGEKIAAELIAIRPDIPIILCTGYSEVLSQERAKEIGIREYLLKPFTRKSLCGAVRRVLDTCQADDN